MRVVPAALLAAMLLPILALESPSQIVSAKDRQPPISVCDAIANRIKYQYRLVSVRGTLRSTPEGSWLDAHDCKIDLKTRGYSWPTSIWIESDSRIYRQMGLDFPYHKEVYQELGRQIRSLSKDPEREYVWLTYIGVLETDLDLESRVISYPSGYVMGFGFGHGGESPARLFVKAFEDLNVKVRPVR